MKLQDLMSDAAPEPVVSGLTSSRFSLMSKMYLAEKVVSFVLSRCVCFRLNKVFALAKEAAPSSV